MKKHCLNLRLVVFLIVWMAGGAFFPFAPGFFPAVEARAEDLSYLLDLDPDTVTAQDLYDRAGMLEENYQAHHCVNGIIWQGRYAGAGDAQPTLYGTGGDSAIFTGFYLAAAVYRFVTTGQAADLAAVFEAARGLHILTHISGMPGVIARCAFPAADAARWRYPEEWQDRIDRGYVYESPDSIPDIGNPPAAYPPMIFYTRATRDQLTGILYGLGVALAELDPAEYAGQTALDVQKVKDIAQEVIRSLWGRFMATGFIIKDQTGATGTTAILVNGLLRVQLLAVYRAALAQREGLSSQQYKRIDRIYSRTFARNFSLNDGNAEALLNRSNLADGYFAFNLRFARGFTVHLLENDSRRSTTVEEYLEKHLWRYVKNHRNTHFSFLYAAATGDDARLEEARRSLRELSFKPLRDWSSPLHGQNCYPPRFVLLYGDVSPYVVPVHLRKPTEYFIWQKEPFQTGQGDVNTEGLDEATGLDFLLPYWMGRHYGFVEAP